jgi:hypothetical protein
VFWKIACGGLIITDCTTKVLLFKTHFCMRVSSLDASLHKQGLSRSSSTKSLNWHEIQIWEYARALGDNPSCSSGAPIR